MRGGRSFLVLLLVGMGLGAYVYFVESKRDLAEPAVKHDKVFAVEPGKIEELEVKSAAGDLTKLKKDGTAWRIVAPEAMDVDETQVSALVNALESLELQRVVDEKPASAAPFGLDPARYSLTFRAAGETATHRLNVGTKTPNGSDLYARVDDQPKVFLISSYVDDTFNRTTFELRDKTILKFSRDEADSLALEAAGQPTLAFAKKGADWRLTKPSDTKADFSAVDGIVGRLFLARMKSFVEADGTKDLKKYGLDKPQVVATIGVGSTRASFAIGAKLADGSFYGRDLSRPLVFTVEATMLDDLKRKADDLRSKDLFAFRAFNAVGLDVTFGGATYTFAKQKAPAPAESTAAPAPDVWKQTKPSAKDVNLTAMTDLLTNLSNLRAEKFADKALAAGTDLVVTARFGEDAAAPRDERVTFRKSGAVVHAIRQGEPGAAIVPAADFDKALAGFKELVGIK